MIFFEPDLSLIPKENEVRLRNIGLEASRRAGCTHHISSDVDEMYKPEELAYAKQVMETGDYDYSVAYYNTYYKDPTFLVYPIQDLFVSLIHPVDNEYNKERKPPEFPFLIETTRRLSKCSKYRVFTRDEITIHHMAYIRKDLRKKFNNSGNGRYYKVNEFVGIWENYKLGDRVCLGPDYLNRRTIAAENIFGIHLRKDATDGENKTDQS
jgi:hypothetical protein